MTFNPFQERRVRVTVTVTRPDAQGNQEPDIYTFVEHRMRIAVSLGGAQYGNARVEVFGVPLDTMNQIARIWQDVLTPITSDTISIDVWNGQDYVPFYQGTIAYSYIDPESMPFVPLVIEANASYALMAEVMSPYSNAGPVKLSDVLKAICTPAGFVVDYSASTTDYMLTNVRLTGSAADQIRAAIAQFPNLTYDVSLQRVQVRDSQVSMFADAVPVNAGNGMQKAPRYSTSGITFTSLFNAQIRPGAALAIDTSIAYINRTQWIAAVVQHTLEPNYPNGVWSTSVAAQGYGKRDGTAVAPGTSTATAP
ncbi:gp40 [Burkholderia phage Bcep1]|uniref:Gp40 n=1 Tax=Burkholderia phage Bcep1 TaxID=2883943 RepID=Q6UIZ1_9CAUD|nr:gp40 [Burkholderia phage Bcep1]AAQ73387.1 gp40 [Burkholderia phage Bcep1]